MEMDSRRVLARFRFLSASAAIFGVFGWRALFADVLGINALTIVWMPASKPLKLI